MNRQAFTLCLALTSLLSIAGPPPAKPKQPAKIDAAVQMEVALWSAAKAKDIAKFSNLVAPDCRMVYSSGFGTLKEETDAIKVANIKSFEILESHVTHPNATTMLISCKIAVSGSSEGKDFSGNIFSTSVWIKVNAKWKMTLHSEVRAK